VPVAKGGSHAPTPMAEAGVPSEAGVQHGCARGGQFMCDVKSLLTLSLALAQLLEFGRCGSGLQGCWRRELRWHRAP
jgi:hypothetical protein